MLNIEQELEYSGEPAYKIKVRQMEGDKYVAARVSETGRLHDTLYFDIKTGRDWDYRNGGCDNVSRIRPRAKVGDVARFYIHGGMRGWPRDKWVKVGGQEYPDGATAADKVKEFNTRSSELGSSYRFMVKREIVTVPNYDFHEWAAFRFETGEYGKLPWHDEPWVIRDHYAHPSLGDSECVAYFKDAVEGQRDYVFTMSAGRYLSTFHSDVLSEVEIAAWVERFESNVELTFTESTPEAIIEAYTSKGAPHSCMAHDKSSYHYNLPMHPVGVYGAGDLAVCLMSRNGKVTGRALVWPEKKVVGRIYGDSNRMAKALEEAGYQLDGKSHNAETYGKGLLNGARILKVPLPNHSNYFTMPYLDFHYQIDDGGEFFLMNQDGECGAYNTDGTMHYPGGHSVDDDYDACAERECDCCSYCDDCGDYTSNDDMRTAGGDSYVCRSCYSNYSSCDCCGERYPSTVEVYDGRNPENLLSDSCNGCLTDYATQINGRWYEDDTLVPNEDGDLVLPETLEAAE